MDKPVVTADQAPDLSARENRQIAHNVGGNAMQVSGNYSNQQTLSFNLMISVFFISIFALGGIAWALNVGLNPIGNPQQTDQSLPAQIEE